MASLDPRYSGVPVRTIRLVLRYDGAAYHGWQRQPGLDTIQARLEQAVLQVTGEAAAVHASGRTDAGVHALGQVAHFNTASALPPQVLLRALNASLPEDVAVVESAEAAPGFHARFLARRKTYVYQFVVGRVRDPLWCRYACSVWTPPDLDAMRAAARELVGRHDFRSFAREGSRKVDTVRTVSALRLFRWSRGIRLFATADGFLQHMVRTLAGTLLAAGTGRIGAGDAARILAAADRRAAPAALPAHGLFLWRVDY